MFFDSNQLITSLLVVFLASAIAGVLVFQRSGPRRETRFWCTILLTACAIAALWSWIRFGDFHTIHVDAPGEQASAPNRRKIERHVPFHFHEFFHYYMGAKYFREVGYEGIYDCAALADKEIAEQDGVKPRIGGYIRDLEDVLRDKPYEAAVAHCQDDLVPHMSPGRWEAFKGDIRELRRLVPDDYWSGVVVDAGFNPPPSWVLVGSAVANVIPIRLAGMSTYLVATSLDVVLLAACLIVIRRAFGAPIAATAAVYFGASFIASYAWNGGAFLRYTWLTTLVLALVATRRGRWALAGALFAASTCDRLFPAGFAFGAVLPLALLALRSVEDRRKLGRFGAGFGGTIVVLVVLSTIVFGMESWRIFFQRIFRHGDVYYVMHIGLKKVLTWRDWVPSQNFHGHAGMKLFHDWNLRLRETWVSMRGVAIPLQLVATGGAVYAGLRRRPYESALLVGIVGMFFFNLPANYYYVVVALVPALLLRAAMTAPSLERRLREFGALTAFNAFWITTLLASRLVGDDIIYDHTICVAMLIFLGVWIVTWLQHPDALRARFPGAARQDVVMNP
jgi:Glycosyltransferase family 87